MHSGTTRVRNDVSRTISDMPSIACRRRRHPVVRSRRGYEVFGADRGLAERWFGFTVCGPDGMEVGDWLRLISDASGAEGRIRWDELGEPTT
jgi:hypothetical protein